MKRDLMEVDADGYIRMEPGILKHISFTHLFSGTYANHENSPAHDGCSEMLGYTEWASTCLPVISLGWDWRLATCTKPLVLVPYGDIQGNLMFTDSSGADLGVKDTSLRIGAFVRKLGWEPVVLAAIGLARLDDEGKRTTNN